MGDCRDCFSLQNQLNEAKALVTARQRTIDELENQVEQATNNLESQVNQHNMIKDQYNNLKNEHTQEKNKYDTVSATQKTQIEKLEKEIKAISDKYQKERDSLMKNVTTLEQKLQIAENELSQKKDSESKLQDQINKCYNLIKESSQGQIGTSEEAVLNLINHNRENTSQNKILTAQKKDLEDQLTILNNALSLATSEIQKLTAEQKETKQTLEKYQKNCGPLEDTNTCLILNNVELKDDKFVKYYDCQILADSFYRLLQNEPWPIEYKDYKNYRERAKKGSVCVSVLGYENTGKSFMVSKVMGQPLPQGKHVKTTGLCILYPDDKEMAWTALDTPGTNVSIKLESMKQELDLYFKKKNATQDDIQRMLYGDNILIESLVQEFVVSHTQVLLILVGKLRRDDQRFINRIKFQKELADKRIIIVHNLLETRDRKNAKKIIKEDILETFGTEKRVISIAGGKKQYVYLERCSPKIEHVVMAHEGSEAGQYYNENTVNYIKQVVKTCAYNDKLDLVDAFHKYLNSHYKTFLSCTKEAPNPFAIQNSTVEDPDTAQSSEMATAITLQGHENYSIKYNLSDEFGHLKTISPGALETVPYTVKLYLKDLPTPKENSNNGESEFESVSPGEKQVFKTEEQSYLQVELEVSGRCQNSNIKLQLENQGKKSILHIKAKSEDNTVREDGGEAIENTRKFGDFIVNTEPIDLMGYTISKSERPTFSDKTPGLKIIRFNLYPIVLDDYF